MTKICDRKPFTVYLDSEMVRRVKIQAAKSGDYISDFIAQLLETALSEVEDEKTR